MPQFVKDFVSLVFPPGSQSRERARNAIFAAAAIAAVVAQVLTLAAEAFK